MTSKAKAAICAVALVPILFAAWWVAREPESPAVPEKADAAKAPGPAAHPATARRAHPAAEDPEARTDAASGDSQTSAAETVAPPVAAGPKRLEVRFVRLGDPVSVEDASSPGTEGRPATLGGSAGGVSLGGGIVAVASKFRPVPERGTASLRGRVIDRTGAALGGARVFRVEPAAGGADGDVVNYAHIVALGDAAADGSFAFEAQPARAYRLAADWCHVMERPRGLLFGGVVAVEPRENQTIGGIELRLPVDTREFGAVTGRVMDDEGNPAEVGLCVGSVVAASGADGRFRIAPVPAGDGELVVGDPGFRPFRRSVTARAGADTEVEVRLEARATGPHEIDGFARDPGGKGVAGITISCRGLDVSRRLRTGSDGSFRFGRLAALPAGAGYTLLVGEEGVLVKVVGGISVPAHGLVVPVERTVKLRLLIREAATSAPLRVFSVTVQRRVTVDGAPTLQPVIVTSLRQDEGSWSADVPRGDLVLLVEAPERRDFHGEVEVPAEDGDFEAVVEMRR